MTLNRLRVVEQTCFAVGLAGVVTVAFALLPRLRAELQLRNSATHAAATEEVAADGGLLGSLEIASVHLSTPVLEGCTEATLRAGSCRMRESAEIGGLGTTAIAGHRDAQFAALRALRLQDEIAVKTTRGTYHYRVERMRVVQPEDVGVLATADEPRLVLITCFPFHFIGSAPKRFVVQARLESVVPSGV